MQVLQKMIDQKRLKVKSTQDTLNFKKMYANGICHVADDIYSKMIRFSDISYQLSQDEMKQRIFAQYSSLLNSFDFNVQLQLNFINYRLQENIVEDIYEYTHGHNNIDLEEFEFYQKEYFNFLDDQREKGSNGIIRNKFIIFSIRDENYENAVRRLAAIESNICSHFRTMGVMTESVSGIERLTIINYLLNGNSEHYVDLESISKEELKKYSLKDYIAPKTMDFGYKKDEFKINNKYATTLHLSIEATELSDRALAEFLDLELEILVSMHIHSLEQQKAVKMVKKKKSDLDSIKIEEQKKAIKAGYDMDILPTDLNMHVEESLKILSDLQRENEKYFYLTFTITVFENTPKDLENAVFQLNSVAQKQNCKLNKMTYQQERGFISALPFGNNITEKDLERGLTTSSTAIFIPFTTQELYQVENEPVYYGLNALSNNMIQVSRKSLKNPNGLFLGTPGSGKSFSAKREIIDTFFRTTDDILICDPEGEYPPFVSLLKGDVVTIGLDSDQYINPLDISFEYGEGGDPVKFKADFILTMIELIAGGMVGLSARQKTIVDRCVHSIYKPYIENPIAENMPILEDLFDAFKKTNTVEGNELADALELYVHGSLNVFNNRTTIDTKNRLICFNIKELGSNLRELGMLVLQDHVWNKVTINRNKSKRTWYYMDEFHKLLAHEQTSSYSIEFWKRFRKWGGIPTGITQNVKDFLTSPRIETILENSDFIYLLNQASGDRQILQNKLSISDYQANYITNSSEGEGLIVYNGVILPFKDQFPKDNSLYAVMTTKTDEIKQLRGAD